MRSLTQSDFIRIDFRFNQIKILIAGAESESMSSEFIFWIKTSESLFFLPKRYHQKTIFART